ncbi:MAG: FAD-binding oxidoreductase [Candidatus Helarchaeota archaeon]
MGKEILSNEIKTELVKIFGNDNVIDTPFRLIENNNPDLIVRATKKTQIIDLVKLASRYNIPLIPKSSKINYNDGTKPEYGGILLDMSDMKTILKIREGSDRCVTIEPGVTFEELQNFLNSKGYKCMAPLGLPCQVSVLSSYLERTPLLSGPQILLSEGSQCIMDLEVVRGDGTTLHTGSASTVPTRPGISPNGPIGPDWTRIFTAAQGSMGIVTEMTVKFKHIPPFQKILLKPYDNLESLLTDMIKIKRIEIGKECLGISNLNMGAILAENKQAFSALRDILPRWTLVLNLAGWEEEEIQILEQDLADLNINFSTGAFKTMTGIQNIEKIFLEEFNLPNKMIKFRGYDDNCQVIPFYATKSKVIELNKEVEKITSKSGYNIKNLYGFIMPIEQARIFYFEYTLYSNNKDIKSLNIAQNLFKEVSEYIINQGGIIDRPYGIWAQIIYSKIPEYLNLLREAKKILDPNGIFNPGKIIPMERR